ncbi:hypothetical protein CY35_07G080100 [Sphagnum magellanicum]|uniref:Uncharacterized protein n=1 Tax=Sphagnum magellanicum TaxID=128215 RepID=A0ACB8HMP2_9BRYO|nr:hypothetical protein CY35_07G080100 [Sphagnum magellanicum]
MRSTFRIPSSLSLLKAAWISYCSCKFCCNLDAVRRWRFAYKLLNVKRSSRNVCANLKKFFTWRRTKCRNMRIKEELSIIWIALVSSSIFYVVCECLVFVLLAMFFVCKRASWPSLPNFDRNPQIVQHLQHSRMNGDFQILTETHKLFNTCQYSRMNGINKEREPLVFCPFEEGFWFSVSDSHAHELSKLNSSRLF